MDVEEWLRGLGLAQYAAAFAENDIDFTLLGKLTDADLKELGISSLGHRKRLLAAIGERGVTAATSPETCRLLAGRGAPASHHSLR